MLLLLKPNILRSPSRIEITWSFSRCCLFGSSFSVGASLGRFRDPDFSAASCIEDERSIEKPGKFVKKGEIYRLLRRGGLATNEYVHFFVKTILN
jgi:hypothetical protein